MNEDDARKHGGNTPGQVPGRPHQRAEEPVRLGDQEPGAPAPDLSGDSAIPKDTDDAMTRTGQASVLGGDVATRSGTAETPDDEKA